ncbi:MAG: hypothetical protein IIA49_14230 [Bacteroidetes bacterium]|nr:hypothetical protein [Bacteroidota bacterium]MCH7772148.1 hypothetical protein [Bacteroidota bacterium]MCH9029051.1 hypothetical protein [Bacteroidota bacterium]
MIVFNTGGIVVICMIITINEYDFNHEVNNFGVGSAGDLFSLIEFTTIAGGRSLIGSPRKIYNAN